MVFAYNEHHSAYPPATPEELEAAVEYLINRGWICVPPITAMQTPIPNQIWRATEKTNEIRKVIKSDHLSIEYEIDKRIESTSPSNWVDWANDVWAVVDTMSKFERYTVLGKIRTDLFGSKK